MQAISQVQHLRDSLGFSPISERAKITMEGSSKSYDAMLHIYQAISSRSIAFKKDGDGYIWIGEQEIFTGPRQYKTVDGIFNETITLNYDKEIISGYPVDTLSINYDGPDSLYTLSNILTKSKAQELIKKWETVSTRP